jgi:hypothetical protein
MDTLKITKGKIAIYRLYDVASEIDLSLVESKANEGVRRLRLSRYPYMKALEFTDPPVSFVLPGFTIQLFDQEIQVKVISKAYDFGVLSLAFYLPIPQDTTFSELERVAKDLDTDESIDEKAKEYIKQLMHNLGSAIILPSFKEEFSEDYMVFMVEKLNKEMEALQLLDEYDLSRLLLYETRDVSQQTKEETLKHRFSYYPDDLVIVHLDNAFVIEPTGSSDILDILEFATAQMLELRYYDHVLDKELARIYREIPKHKRASIFDLRSYEVLAKKITETVTELTAVTEKVDNALKVTEDVYYARIYRTAMHLFRSQDWEDSIKEKLQVVTKTYTMLYEDISTRRGHLLEWGIIILIVIEIILLILMEW